MLYVHVQMDEHKALPDHLRIILILILLSIFLEISTLQYANLAMESLHL
jgi:hypothetical protein